MWFRVVLDNIIINRYILVENISLTNIKSGHDAVVDCSGSCLDFGYCKRAFLELVDSELPALVL